MKPVDLCQYKYNSSNIRSRRTTVATLGRNVSKYFSHKVGNKDYIPNFSVR